MKMLKNRSGQFMLTLPMLIIIAIILLPIIIGGTALSIKMIQLMFFTSVGSIPVWAFIFLVPLLIWVIRAFRR